MLIPLSLELNVMLKLKNKDRVVIDDYLQGELASDIKHELIDGYVYAMAGASANHERIAGNIYRKFGNHLDGVRANLSVRI